MKKVHLFIPCFIDQLYPETGISTVKLLRKAGVEVIYNPNQTCCGQPAFNAGFWEDAKPVCEKFLKDFADAELIVTPSGSCAGFVKNHYEKLFKGTAQEGAYHNLAPRIRELSDVLVNELGYYDFGASLEGVAVYHDACGALRECGIKNEPRQLLAHVSGLKLVESPDCETCCGFGGTFSTKFEPISLAMAEQKADNAIALGAKYLISTDSSCLLHLDGYLKKFNRPLKTMHLADVLASGL